MKHWLIWLYPLAWRRRYGEEFSALLDQQPLTLHDVLDIMRGALDAHWRKMMHAEQEHCMWTFTIRIHRRTIHVLATLLLSYVATYGIVRTTGGLVHTAQNPETVFSRHDVQQPGHFGNPTAPLALLYFPARIAESTTWSVIDIIRYQLL